MGKDTRVLTSGNWILILLGLLTLVIMFFQWIYPFEPVSKSPVLTFSTCPTGTPAERCDIALEIEFDANSEKISPGDSFAYTLVIKNTGRRNVDPVYIALSLSPYLEYVSGSTFVYGEAEPHITIADGWLSTGLNLGQLSPGQAVEVLFATHVREDTEEGSLIESVIQLKKTWLADDMNEWLQCAAQSIVNVP